MDKFTEAYIEAALWSSNNDDGTPLDQVEAELSDEAREAMRRDCEQFQRDNAALLQSAREAGRSDDYLGHDFWLTRNGHGTGFWDRGLGTIGSLLTDACKKVGGANLYVSDMGTIEHD